MNFILNEKLIMDFEIDMSILVDSQLRSSRQDCFMFFLCLNHLFIHFSNLTFFSVKEAL